MHVHIVFCCGPERVLFTNKLSECWCRISIPCWYRISRELHKLACPIVMYGRQLFIVVFQKVYKVFTKTLISLFPACHQRLYLHQVSYVDVLQLTRFANSTRRGRRRRRRRRRRSTIFTDIYCITSGHWYIILCLYMHILPHKYMTHHYQNTTS